MDTYDQVEDWMGEIQGQDGVQYWTVSMVLDGSDPHHVEVYPEDPEERSIWQHNAVAIAVQGEYQTENVMDRATQVIRATALMPKSMVPPEVFATVMNVLNMYFDSKEDQVALLQSCLGSIDAVHSAREKIKKNTKRMIN